MASIWVVFHDDIEDAKWVRVVYATRELAEAAIPLPDVEIVEHNANCQECTGRHVYWHVHGDWCCSADEWPISEDLPAKAEPETPRRPDADTLVSEALMYEIMATMTRPNPYRESIRGAKPPRG